MNTKSKPLAAAGMLFALLMSATLTHAQPVITTQPADQTVLAGVTVMFSVGATGTEPLTYQWRSYANATVFTNILLGTEATLVLINVQPTSQRFAVVVTDGSGLSVTSQPQARLTVLVPPVITAQPASQTVVAGSSVTFSLGFTGVPAPSIQWRFNGADLPDSAQRI